MKDRDRIPLPAAVPAQPQSSCKAPRLLRPRIARPSSHTRNLPQDRKSDQLKGPLPRPWNYRVLRHRLSSREWNLGIRREKKSHFLYQICAFRHKDYEMSQPLEVQGYGDPKG